MGMHVPPQGGDGALRGVACSANSKLSLFSVDQSQVLPMAAAGAARTVSPAGFHRRHGRR
jgi:hypothetical protein